MAAGTAHDGLARLGSSGACSFWTTAPTAVQRAQLCQRSTVADQPQLKRRTAMANQTPGGGRSAGVHATAEESRSPVTTCMRSAGAAACRSCCGVSASLAAALGGEVLERADAGRAMNMRKTRTHRRDGIPLVHRLRQRHFGCKMSANGLHKVIRHVRRRVATAFRRAFP
jgi:hypothetical protein